MVPTPTNLLIKHHFVIKKEKKEKKKEKTNRPKPSTDSTKKKYFVYCLVLNEFPFLPEC